MMVALVLASLVVGDGRVTTCCISSRGIQIVNGRTVVPLALTERPYSKKPYFLFARLAFAPSIARTRLFTTEPATGSRNRPVRSLSVVGPFPSSAKVTPGSGRPSSINTRPEMAVTPGGAVSGASDSHGDGGRFVRQPFWMLSASGTHTSVSTTFVAVAG